MNKATILLIVMCALVGGGLHSAGLPLIASIMLGLAAGIAVLLICNEISTPKQK